MLKTIVVCLVALSACVDGPEIGSDTSDLLLEEELLTVIEELPTPRVDYRCSLDLECSQYRYCKFDSCGSSQGQCEPFPSQCGQWVKPVCGCDGVVYDNSCMASEAGASIDHSWDSCE